MIPQPPVSFRCAGFERARESNGAASQRLISLQLFGARQAEQVIRGGFRVTAPARLDRYWLDHSVGVQLSELPRRLALVHDVDRPAVSALGVEQLHPQRRVCWKRTLHHQLAVRGLAAWLHVDAVRVAASAVTQRRKAASSAFSVCAPSAALCSASTRSAILCSAATRSAILCSAIRCSAATCCVSQGGPAADA